MNLPETCDIAVIGAGAAGLATAIFARRANPRLRVIVLDSARTPGAKILVSGGSRCNVTNVSVHESDFWGGPSTRAARSGHARAVRRILEAFPPDRTIAFFRDLGVALHEEADGKLFPDSNRSRDVLEALLRGLDACGATVAVGHRVLDIVRTAGGFRIVTAGGDLIATRVVLATGGRSLPKTGSDGSGLEIARRLGHTIVDTTPALTPLLLHDEDALHRTLSGVAQPVQLTVWIDDAAVERIAGAMLWTHFGVSGPAALNASRHYLRAELEHRPVKITVNFCGGASFDAIDRQWTDLAAARPKASIQTALASLVPASLADALLRDLRIGPGTTLAHLSRDERRRLTHALTAWLLPIIGARGYNHAEVTAGGVALAEVDAATMASRVVPGLHLVGEMLDVDGRIGGFNFQWAWATGFVAGTALGR